MVLGMFRGSCGRVLEDYFNAPPMLFNVFFSLSDVVEVVGGCWKITFLLRSLHLLRMR